MYKPKSLRKALTDAVPDLARNPEMMRIFIDNGKLASTLAASLSFENQYTLNVVVTDFTGDIELLLVPIQAWLRIHQADIMTTDEGRKKGFTYFADINDNDSADISISLMLTERTIVREDGNKLHIETVPEPQPPEPLV
ncbi:TPA: phage tail protein [Escherichia coli]|uniref:phage tail protein n=1 Tax=Enterobacteriaceae TaxID=543 RepID=UPI000D730467|nr:MULTISPECIES: phage tail protein [Enterobacteriaceae]PXA37973.1 phage tail protein [Escherichia coli]UAK20244.1 phage tail protein [Kluyvera sp. CRP]UAK21173.1 phage tail protein [Kluyvera sp. CRP]HAI0063230.1 phage tail protein [Escherichia coli]HAM3595595.1 phage tail protein [Escherichia coli]